MVAHGTMFEVNFVVSLITMNKMRYLLFVSHICYELWPSVSKTPTFCCNGYLQGISKKRMLVVGGIPFFDFFFFSMTPIGYHGKNVYKKQHRSLCLVTPVISCFALHIVTKVERSFSKNLSAQGRPDPRGGLCCFWHLNKTSTPLIGTSSALKIVKNKLELRKLRPSK